MHHKSNNSKKSTICPCKCVWSLRETWSTRGIKIACQKFCLVWSLFLSIFFLIPFFAQYQICIKPVSCKRKNTHSLRRGKNPYWRENEGKGHIINRIIQNHLWSNDDLEVRRVIYKVPEPVLYYPIPFDYILATHEPTFHMSLFKWVTDSLNVKVQGEIVLRTSELWAC